MTKPALKPDECDCPSPENPCMCSCHRDRWGAECWECRMGRHKPRRALEPKP